MLEISALNQIIECYRVLQKTGGNIVNELLRQSSNFLQWDHYPKGDVLDRTTHSQYYYHAHPPVGRDIPPEHGHFHCFLRKEGMPAGALPLALPTAKDTNQADLAHIIAISMDKFGFPIGLFTTNRWVTGEAWYSAQDVINMLDHFNIDHAWPSWPLNLWLTNMVRLFKADIIELILERDKTINAWRLAHPGVDVFENRELEITSYKTISVDERAKLIALSPVSDTNGAELCMV